MILIYLLKIQSLRSFFFSQSHCQIYPTELAQINNSANVIWAFCGLVHNSTEISAERHIVSESKTNDFCHTSLKGDVLHPGIENGWIFPHMKMFMWCTREKRAIWRRWWHVFFWQLLGSLSFAHQASKYVVNCVRDPDIFEHIWKKKKKQIPSFEYFYKFICVISLTDFWFMPSMTKLNTFLKMFK